MIHAAGTIRRLAGTAGAAIAGLLLCACGDIQTEDLRLTGRAQGVEKEWTLLLYFSADSGNEGGAIGDVNALERGVDLTDTNVIVQLDRIPGYDSSNGDWTDCRRFFLEPDPSGDNLIRSTEVENIGEVNMGDPQTLADFITWGVQSYPARKYAVMVWGGAMPNGIAADFSEPSPDPIRTIFGELTEAYALATAAIERRLDLCVLWGCNYGMFENDYVIREYCDVTARSEIPTNYMLAAGTAIPTWLNANPAASAREFGGAWVDGYIDTAVLMGAWAAVDMGPGFVRLGLAVDDFARELVKAGGTGQADIAAAMANTVHCYAAEFDLNHFAKNIADETALPQPLRDAAQSVIDAYGYPPQAGMPLANFRFVDGGITGNETWPTGDTAELRGTKIRQTAYQDGGYLPFVANNAWHWFLSGETALPAEPLVTYDSNSQGDTLESGASVSFGVTLRNSGGAAATGVTGTLSTTDTHVTIDQDASAYPDIASEATSASQTPYSLSVNAAAPPGHRIWFWLDLSAGGGSYANTTSFCLEVTGCTDGATRPCYEGPDGTQGVGICRAGMQACGAGVWGTCENQVLPGTESCADTLDNDCDGLTDAEDPECAACTDDADCDDGDVCNGAETCQGGSCTAGTALGCDDGNPCTTDSCDPVGGCQNENNDLPCDDGDACTMNDTCAGGACAGDPLDADGDGHVSGGCGGDDCDDADGQVHPGMFEGSAGTGVCTDGVDNDCDGLTDDEEATCRTCNTDAGCDDANVCNGAESCQGGSCVAGTALDCDDDNPCTTDSCDPAGGCQTVDNSLPCDDGDECTQDDACTNGVCVGSTPAEVCDDGFDNDCDGLTDADDGDCDENGGVSGGCGCGGGTGGATGWPILLVLVPAAVRRRGRDEAPGRKS